MPSQIRSDSGINTLAKPKRSEIISIGILLALFFATALFSRVYFPYDQVFGGDLIKYTGVDAYYHMRVIDNHVHNFPHVTGINAYFIYPTAISETSLSFFHWFLSSIIWLVGLGSPTEHIVDIIGVYFPAVLGALTVIPLYFIGKELMNRWGGIIAAGLIAVLPGEFIGRSILGFTDHHIAETLFTALAMLFLVLAIKTARQRELTYNHLKRQHWATIRKPIIYSLIAGIFLGIYLLTWTGALLFVFIISVYTIIQSIIDHIRHQSTDYLCIVTFMVTFISLIVFVPTLPSKLHLAALIIAVLIPLALGGFSWLLNARNIRPAYYPLALVVSGLAAIGIFYLVNPSLISSIFGTMGSLFPRGASLTTIEMQPLLFPNNQFTLTLAWGNFTTGFYISIICIGVLIYEVVKHNDAGKNLLLVWSLVILTITLFLQRRFAYYFAVNVALLTGYLTWWVLSKTFFKEPMVKPRQRPVRRSQQKTGLLKNGFPVKVNHVITGIVLVIVFVIVFLWNIQPAIDTASAAQFAPSDAWVSSLSWLRENTPDPMGNPDAYYGRQELTPGENYEYPESVYGVLAWWDYGYWITRIGHRIPNANPSQNVQANTNVANFFTSQDEISASEIADELGSSYIIADYETATSKFYAVSTWAGKEAIEFWDYYWVLSGDRWSQMPLFHQEYYQSQISRLYNFDGQAVIPESVIVISYREQTDQQGIYFKAVTSWEEFDSYEEAETYISEQETDDYHIVGTNPFVSPVPLEALEHYKLIYSSESAATVSANTTVPLIKIFEYTD